MSKYSLVIVVAALLCACSPYHDLKDGRPLLGGGFKDQEVGHGLFGIMVKSNVSLWKTHDAVHETWMKRADELCGGKGYVELASQDSEDELQPTSGAIRDVITTRIGFALCSYSELSQEQALSIIADLGLLPRKPAER
jgi:hypothetical protein